MYSQFIASPDASESQSQLMSTICANASSFEQLIYEVMLLPTRLEIIKFKAEGRSIVAIHVRCSDTPLEKEIGHIFLPAKKLKKYYNIQPVPRPVGSEKSSNRKRCAWFIDRYERLNLPGKVGPGGLVAPPSAMPELILSYVLTSMGSAIVTRTHPVAECMGLNAYLQLELACAFPVAGMQQEFFCVPFDQLERLVETQLVRKALPYQQAVMNESAHHVDIEDRRGRGGAAL